jgi:hypothetical protein
MQHNAGFAAAICAAVLLESAHSAGSSGESSISDPTMFSRTWRTQTIWFRLLPDTELVEHICENETDVALTPRQ